MNMFKSLSNAIANLSVQRKLIVLTLLSAIGVIAISVIAARIQYLDVNKTRQGALDIRVQLATSVLDHYLKQAQDALGILRQFNPSASQIGVVQASDRHKVILNNPWGSRRYLELPQGELLPRIC